ncbi:type VI secretion system baseplate subunit TssG [Chromobacterium haemolyticum]|uniref:Type VI secretion system baseplate subunit TssG n=1 Tax=Chromobacterium haemolyticum TaxID=394935 RepID=A0A1W0CE00_9NEIS|nr:type VI secretion system baseplate subunit TssG [Chromobacterium haemolyticum]OQS32955.1 hypothetical protein B0T45_20995 [Chromobacterium haemolyticum]
MNDWPTRIPHPERYEFFALLRQIEAGGHDKVGFGRSLRPSEDDIRLSQRPDLGFQPGSVQGWHYCSRSARHKLSVSVLGVFGANGPMPLHFTEYARDRLFFAKDASLCSFLDIFHHRMLSLFYRAWANTEPCVSFDQPQSNIFDDYLGSLFGGLNGVTERVPDSLFYAGRLLSPVRSAEGLSAILQDYFSVPISIEPFMAEWLTLHEADRSVLSVLRPRSQLGHNSALGRHIYSAQHKFCIRIGPLTLNSYMNFIPSGKNLSSLLAWVRLYTGSSRSFSVMLSLQANEVPRLRLGRGGRLAYMSWLGHWKPKTAADGLSISYSTQAAIPDCFQNIEKVHHD